MKRLHKACFPTVWGWMEVEASEKGVRSITWLRSHRNIQKRTLGSHPASKTDESATLWQEARTQLLEYLAGTRRTFSLPVDMSDGTPFQRKVWRASLRIPYGRVRSYRWLAMRVGGTQYARAVGTALGRNPVPMIVPCHRIIAHDGSLGGFTGGLPMKRRLLRLEGTLDQLDA